jgi:hypothetical protein
MVSHDPEGGTYVAGGESREKEQGGKGPMSPEANPEGGRELRLRRDGFAGRPGIDGERRGLRDAPAALP